MILQALKQCYELMERDPQFTVALPGYSAKICSFALVIDRQGNLLKLLDLRENKRGRDCIVPWQKDRTSGIYPYFLCENCKYLLGSTYDKKADSLISFKKNLEEAATLHKKILADVNEEAAQAVLKFFAKRQAEKEVLLDPKNDFYSSGLAVFYLDGEKGYIHEQPAIREAWEKYYRTQLSEKQDQILGQCLISGQEAVGIAPTHALLKGVMGGKSTGGSLVSFNFPAAQSYGKTQSYNSPVSDQAMFCYTTALNTLLARSENRLMFGDLTCVFWTEKEVYSNAVAVFMALFDGNMPEEKALRLHEQCTEQIANILLRAMLGNEISPDMLAREKDTTAYILGLSPNAARLAVRFWYKDTFGHFTEHVAEHFSDMEIIKSEKAKKFVPVRDLLTSIAAFGKSDNVPKAMERALLQAIVSGSLYPLGVYTNILLRIRAEAGDEFAINRTRAGFIKAYLQRKYRKTSGIRKSEEEITVALNEESTSVPYQLGRLFAVLERLQEAAKNKNLREKYFAAASTNPERVFPTILKLSQSHLIKVSKMSVGTGIFFDKLCGSILDKLTEDNAFPKSLLLEEQGMFILGYYQQRQFFYTPKAKQVLTEVEKLEENQ